MSDERPSPLLQLTLWRVREFLREPEAVFWVFAFPVLLAFALGLAFRNKGPEPVAVGVLDGKGSGAVEEALGRHPSIEAVVLDSAEAARRLRMGPQRLRMAHDQRHEVGVRAVPRAAARDQRADQAAVRAAARGSHTGSDLTPA